MTSESDHPSLILFGAGYLGTAVAREALARGWSVGAVTRNAETGQQLAALGCDPVAICQLESEAWWSRFPMLPDYLLNSVGGGGRGLEGYRSSYIGGMESIQKWVETRKAQGKGHFIYTSSTGVYEQDDGAWVDESGASEPNTNTRPGLLRLAEELALGISTFSSRTVLRLGGLYGPDRSYMVRQVREAEGKMEGDGAYYVNLIHRDDVVDALFALWTRETPEIQAIFNLTDHAPVMKSAMVDWIARKLGYFPPEWIAPDRQGKPNWRQPKSRKVNSQAIRVATGWTPRYPSYREGLASILSARA